MLRRFAFKYSESSYSHWLPLMLADRVNVVEGICSDLRHGRAPNIFTELGGKAEWKHNRRTLATRILAVTVLTLAAVTYMRSDREDS